MASYVLPFMFPSTLWKSDYHLFSRNLTDPGLLGSGAWASPSVCCGYGMLGSSTPCPVPLSRRTGKSPLSAQYVLFKPKVAAGQRNGLWPRFPHGLPAQSEC